MTQETETVPEEPTAEPTTEAEPATEAESSETEAEGATPELTPEGSPVSGRDFND